MRVFWTALALVILTACSTEDDRQSSDSQSTQSTEPATAAQTSEAAETEVDAATMDEEDLRALARDPEALREAMQDPERREALRERMRALREQRRADGESTTEDRRAAMNERAEQFRNGRQSLQEGEARVRGRVEARFWTDESTVEMLGLTEDQIATLDAAYTQLGATSRESRQALAEVSSGLADALADIDRDALEQLVERRREALAARAAAEADWMASLLSTLSDDQLRQLAEDQPTLIRRLVSPN